MNSQRNWVFATNSDFLIVIYNLATRFPRPLIFQNINSGRSKSLSLKYQRFTPSGCKDIGVRKCKFVAKTQFLSENENTKIFDGFESEDIWISVWEVLIKYVFDREGVVGSWALASIRN